MTRNVYLGYVLAAVNSVLAALTAFGVEMSQEQMAAILGVVNAFGLCALALNDFRLKKNQPQG